MYKYDVSMAVADMYELVHVMRRRLAAWPDVRVLVIRAALKLCCTVLYCELHLYLFLIMLR